MDKKNPISLLQEYMVEKKRILPNYTLIKEKSGCHDNQFVYKVECGDDNAEASGSSKKKAKFLAACELLKLLKIKDDESTNSEFDVISLSNSSISSERLEIGKSIELNYIGKLQEFAVSRGVYPKYDYQTVGGLCHNPIFTCNCTYKDFKEQAEGGNKKIAKHLAAKKMYYRVTSHSADLLLSALSIKSKYAEIENESNK